MSAPTATARAPATIANLAVGFDILGFALASVADEVTVTRTGRSRADAGPVVVDAVEGVADVPRDPARNTASRALLAMIEDLRLPLGFRVALRKGIPLGSGMGGSAASAVGAVVAANALLDAPVSLERLLDYALEGESVASGARHADNVAPCLFGGLCAILPGEPLGVVPVHVPDGIVCVVAHPHARVDTREARRGLSADVPLALHVEQSAHLAAFIAACYREDLDLMGRAMQDLVIGPQRQHRIPGFEAVRHAALRAGAIGCGIAGSGPSVFAWAPSGEAARAAGTAMAEAFDGAGIDSDVVVASVQRGGAEVVRSS